MSLSWTRATWAPPWNQTWGMGSSGSAWWRGLWLAEWGSFRLSLNELQGFIFLWGHHLPEGRVLCALGSSQKRGAWSANPQLTKLVTCFYFLYYGSLHQTNRTIGETQVP